MQALIVAEVANFPKLRRALGVARADLLALELAERAAALFPSADVMPSGRQAIEICMEAESAETLESAVVAVRDLVGQPLQVDGVSHPVLLAIGAATVTDGNPVTLAEKVEADLALARARGASLPSPQPERLQDQMIGEELRAAVTRDELFLQYQPKLHLRRQEITSLEALIRWRHPERGLVLPNDFIPAAERSAAIKAITLWTLRQVVADQRALSRNSYDLPIFINIAGVLLSDEDFVEQTCAVVKGSGAKLGFEITETSVIREPHIAIGHLQRLADIGVMISIDDYGAGLSSLAYLKQLPARELKIDKLFVTQLSSSHRDPLIVRSTIDLAHALEMEVVAEGVETPTSLALLSVMGCDMVQGFLISRPVGFEALLAYLREERHRELLEKPRLPLQRLAAVRARA